MAGEGLRLDRESKRMSWNKMAAKIWTIRKQWCKAGIKSNAKPHGSLEQEALSSLRWQQCFQWQLLKVESIKELGRTITSICQLRGKWSWLVLLTCNPIYLGGSQVQSLPGLQSEFKINWVTLQDPVWKEE